MSEEELSTDLRALGAIDNPDADEPGRRLLGEFFFMHTAEATLQGAHGDAPSDQESRPRRARRSYEFLHATFGEFLVAHKLLECLRDLSDVARGGRRPREPDDKSLMRLSCHQALASRRSILAFLAISSSGWMPQKDTISSNR